MTYHHLDAFRAALALLLTRPELGSGPNHRPAIRPAGPPTLEHRAAPGARLPLWSADLTAAENARRLSAWWRVNVPSPDAVPERILPIGRYADWLTRHAIAAFDADTLTIAVRRAHAGAGRGAAGVPRQSHQLVLSLPDGHVPGVTADPTVWACLQRSDPAVLAWVQQSEALRGHVLHQLGRLPPADTVLTYFRAAAGLTLAEDNLDASTPDGLASLFALPQADAPHPHQNGPGSTIAPYVGQPYVPGPSDAPAPSAAAVLAQLGALDVGQQCRVLRGAAITLEQRAALAQALMLTTSTELRRAGDEAGARRAARVADRCAGVLTPGTWPRGGRAEGAGTDTDPPGAPAAPAAR